MSQPGQRGYLRAEYPGGEIEDFLISAAHVVNDFPEDLRERLTLCDQMDVAALHLRYLESGFNLVSGAVPARRILCQRENKLVISYFSDGSPWTDSSSTLGGSSDGSGGTQFDFEMSKGDIVFKLGRSTGLTFGRLAGLMNMATENRVYEDVLCVMSEEGRPFTQPGDSGAIYFTITKDARAVALAVHLAKVKDNETLCIGRPFPVALVALGFGQAKVEFLPCGQIVRVVSEEPFPDQ